MEKTLYDTYMSEYECKSKYELDEKEKQIPRGPKAHFPRKGNKRPEYSKWEKKAAYKAKLMRRFLSINPWMDLNEVEGMRCPCADVIDNHCDDRWTNLNPYTKVFISTKGDVRKYHGEIRRVNRYYYELCGKENRYAR